MREVLFKGKLESNQWKKNKCHLSGKWVYGHYVGYSESIGYIYGDYIDKDEVWKVRNETVGQFTGLLDKNDNMIFEGDIVVNHATKGTVIFEDGMFTLTMSANVQFGKYKQPLCYLDMESSEVIGNIHEGGK